MLPLYNNLNEVVIEDVVVTGARDASGRCPSGETLIGDASESFEKLNDRIVSQVKFLSEKSSKISDKEGDDKTLNWITRLVTNEFYFYTKTPLDIKQFEKLMQSISDIASKSPQNLHLILSSFAVKRPDGVVMNVTPYVQCGKETKLDLIVKNYPSCFDPVYQVNIESDDKNEAPLIMGLANATSDKHNAADNATDVNVSEHSIEVNGKLHPFSYNNVIQCRTPQNIPFVSCVDVCLDHHYGTARRNLFNYFNALFDKELKSVNLPTDFLVNHVIVSNSIEVEPANTLTKKVTHADPAYGDSPSATLTHGHLFIEKGEKIKFGTPFHLKRKVPIKISNLLSDVLVQIIHNKKNVDAFLDLMKDRKEFNINTCNKDGCPPLGAALMQRNYILAKKFIDEYKAECKLVLDYALKAKSHALFQNALQLPEFRKIVDIKIIAEEGMYDFMVNALGEGIEYQLSKEDIKKIEDDDCRNLLTIFEERKSAAEKMKFKLEGTTLTERIGNYFKISTPFTLKFWRDADDKDTINKEVQLKDKLHKDPDSFDRIIKEAIKNELKDYIPDKFYLQKLMYIQQNAGAFKSITPTSKYKQ